MKLQNCAAIMIINIQLIEIKNYVLLTAPHIIYGKDNMCRKSIIIN